jgi:hypothetical protein
MIRWSPMARATSRLAGWPVVYDLSQITHLTRVLPKYDPIVRRIETITRRLREKKFAVRVGAEIGFQVPHSRTLNTLARWYEMDFLNVLQNPFDLTGAQWPITNATISVSPAKDPVGTFTAFRLTDASGAATGLLLQNTGIAAANQTGLFTLFARADAPHIFSIGIQDNGAYATDLDVDAQTGWRRVMVRRSFPNDALNFQAMIRATQLVVGQTGVVDLFSPTLRKIGELPGTDEEILADLKDKLSSDDWDVELTLDGGITWREVLLDEHEKIPLQDKWVGYSERFVLTCSQPLTRVPPTLDGIW